jgi:hypothetical protein
MKEKKSVSVRMSMIWKEIGRLGISTEVLFAKEKNGGFSNNPNPILQMPAKANSIEYRILNTIFKYYRLLMHYCKC